jgi:hypothetical protein
MAEGEVGVGFQLGELLVGAKVDLFARLDSIDKRLASILEREEQYEQNGPVFVSVAASGVVDSGSDPLYLDLGGPTYGRVWEIRQLVIGGITWATTVAGNAVVLVQPVAPSATNPAGTAGIQDQAASLPSVAFYSGGQFRVRHPNHIWVAILSGTASTQYVVAGDAFDMPDKVSGGAVFTA